ncbi:hypothetical protein, partial [Vibrio genomosp. F10]|uniref:hypothetical protein n=1 Tax=Vibrio genomosp. F10 TaxID=723171 RepID=UPI001969AB02
VAAPLSKALAGYTVTGSNSHTQQIRRNSMEVFGMVGMTFGIIGMTFGIIVFAKLVKLESQLKESGVLGKDYK